MTRGDRVLLERDEFDREAEAVLEQAAYRREVREGQRQAAEEGAREDALKERIGWTGSEEL